MTEPNFKVGEVVIYQNGDRYELGIVKKVIQYEERAYSKEQGFPPQGEPQGKLFVKFDYFVNYHTGDTAARTNERDLHKIANIYAFNVRRKGVDE